MATYKIDSSLLTAQADEIRTLNGTTATMNPSQMTTALQSANAEVAEQEQKIVEITEMLQGKAMGGGSGTSVETCTVTINSITNITYLVYTGIDSEGLTKHIQENPGTLSCTFVAVQGSLILFRKEDESDFIVSSYTNADYLMSDGDGQEVVYLHNNATTATITIFEDLV